MEDIAAEFMHEIRTYTDVESLFELEVPADWLADTSGQVGTRVAFISPNTETGFQANVNVVVNHIPPLTNDEFLTLSRLQLKQMARLAKLPVDEPCGERPGTHVFEWVNNQAPVPLTIRQQVFFSHNKAFILSATALASNFDDHRRTFQSIFFSFQTRDSDGRAPRPGE